MNGAVGTGRFSIGQQSPFVNKVGNDQESMNTVKLTPKYERQMQQRQQFMQGNNMFSSLTGGNSIISTAKTNIFQQAPGDTFNSKANHSLDMTTNVTGNISTQREQSPGQVQHSVEMPQQHSQIDVGNNVFNFAPATQRTPINLEKEVQGERSLQDSLNQNITNRNPSINTMNEFGEVQTTQNTSYHRSLIPPNTHRKKPDNRIVTQLQPKLINPPNKLNRTLDMQAALSTHARKKNSHFTTNPN